MGLALSKGRKVRVFVVDDDPTVAAYFVALLRKLDLGCTTEVFNSGEALLERIAGHDKLPDTILLDITLPGINGFETCRRLREDTALPYIPIVFVTAAGFEDESQARAYDVGGDDFVPKGTGANVLLARLRSVLRIKRLHEDLVSEHARVERELRLSEERFNQIAEAIQEIFWLEELPSGRIVYVSPAVEGITGIPRRQFLHNPKRWRTLVQREDRGRLMVLLTDARTREINTEVRIVRADGRERWIRARVFPVVGECGAVRCRVGIAADVTEYKEAAMRAREQQEQLVQADKMASLGVLVSGVAHEINNPNNLITLNTDLVKRFWAIFTPVVEAHRDEIDPETLGAIEPDVAIAKTNSLLDGITAGAERIKRIVGSLREFTRKGTGKMDEEVGLREVVESAVTIVYGLIRNSTRRFSVSHDERLPSIKGNSQRLEQVIINLIANACHALESQEGSVLVSTHYDALKRKAIVQVADTGRGIPKEILSKVMDPFFTTKRDMGGTGLGLSVSYSIVREHQGDLVIESQEGVGTTVRVILPAGAPPRPRARIGGRKGKRRS
jgi:PAS domain S-box-containing protein